MAVSVLPSSAASGGEPGGPVRAGMVPALADGFLLRTETAPRLPAALIPAAVVVLVPERSGTSGPSESPGRSAEDAASATGPGGAVTDWAGVTGKTQIAAAYADALHRAGAAIIWADAASRVSVLAGYTTAAAAVGIDAGQGADTAVRLLLADLASAARPWLVVLDGLRDPADVRDLIPGGPAGMTLITTADARLIPDSWRAMIVPVSPFSGREAMSYLRSRLVSDWDQRAGMINLVTEIGGEPAALAQASGVIAASPMSCRQYAEQFILRRQRMTRTGGPLPPPAAVTLALAVERADQLSAAAWPTLIMAAVLGGQRIPSAVFSASAVARYMTGESHLSVSAMAETLRLLAHFGLASVDAQPEGLAVRISQPVLVSVRAALARDDHDGALAAAVAGVTEAWPGGETPDWLGSMLVSCSVSLWRVAGDRLWADGNCPRLLRRTGDYLISAGMLGAALTFWADVLAAAERLLEPDHPDTLMIAGKVAALYLAEGEPARAAVHYEWISKQLFRTLGADHPAPIAAQLDLGRSLAADGEFGRAVSVLDLAATEYKRVLGPDHLETVAAVEHLAAACMQAEERPRAITLYRRALADRLRLQGPRYPEAIAARQRLARAYLAAGDVKAAVSESKKVVADRQRELGENHIDTVAAIGDLGTALQAAGRTTQAVEMLEQARAGYEQILGPDHRETLSRCADLARAYYAVGWIVDAAMLLRETAERCDRLLPPGDALTASVRELLARAGGR
jgi:tetratricopeptide (TPR) repeat protein